MRLVVKSLSVSQIDTPVFVFVFVVVMKSFVLLVSLFCRQFASLVITMSLDVFFFR